MQHTYHISKAAPILSYLPRLIKIVRADFERSANMPNYPLINYPPSDHLLHKTPKNRTSVLILSHIQSFILIPLVIASRATVIEYRVHSTQEIFLKLLFRTPRTSKREDSSKSRQRFFFHDDNSFPYGKLKR